MLLRWKRDNIKFEPVDSIEHFKEALLFSAGIASSESGINSKMSIDSQENDEKLMIKDSQFQLKKKHLWRTRKLIGWASRHV